MVLLNTVRPWTGSPVHLGLLTLAFVALTILACDPREACTDLNDCAEDQVCAEEMCVSVGSSSEWADPCPTPQAVKACYTGPVGTALVGECRNGLRTCSGGRWGRCVGQIRPVPEKSNQKDDDCDGQVDEPAT